MSCCRREEPRLSCQQGVVSTYIVNRWQGGGHSRDVWRTEKRWNRNRPFSSNFLFLRLHFHFSCFLPLLSCLFPLLSLLSSPLPRSLNHYLTFTASLPRLNPLHYSCLQSLLTSLLCSALFLPQYPASVQ